MNTEELIQWLLEGDVSIQYQTRRDLLSEERSDIQQRISEEGWGAQFLSKRHPDGHWGKQFYEPKWISSHYTLLDLKNLGISPNHPLIQESIQYIINNEKGPDGGVKPIGANKASDVCVNGMFLNYAAYFKTEEEDLKSIIDFLLSQRMQDGGFNCRSTRGKPVHSSLHSTISVLEGITEYQKREYNYRSEEMEDAKQNSIEFILLHKLFISDRTGEIIKKDFLKIPYPCQWRYDILRAMDYFQHAKIDWDDRMKPALQMLLKKRNKNGTWNVQAKHPGKIHFEMEKAGKPSRWNTLRMLRVLKAFTK